MAVTTHHAAHVRTGEIHDSVTPLLPPFALQLSRIETRPCNAAGGLSVSGQRPRVQEFFFVLSHYVMAGDVLVIRSVVPYGVVAHATSRQHCA